MRGVLFDFDGVLVRTDELHYRAWQSIAAQHGIPFDRQTGEALRGLGRTASLDVLLRHAGRHYSPAEKLALAQNKNDVFLDLVQTLTPADVLPGVIELLADLARHEIRTAVASSSRNVHAVTERVGLTGRFDAVVDGNDVEQTKPDPQVFLLAASQLGLLPAECVVIEDAPSGIEAARRAGMAVFGVGDRATLGQIQHATPDLTTVTAATLSAIVGH